MGNQSLRGDWGSCSNRLQPSSTWGERFGDVSDSYPQGDSQFETTQWWWGPGIANCNQPEDFGNFIIGRWSMSVGNPFMPYIGNDNRFPTHYINTPLARHWINPNRVTPVACQPSRSAKTDGISPAWLDWQLRGSRVMRCTCIFPLVLWMCSPFPLLALSWTDWFYLWMQLPPGDC